MPSSDTGVEGMPNRTEVIERLRVIETTIRSGFKLSLTDDDATLLTQAAELLEAGEGRTEYQTVTELGGGPSVNGPFTSLRKAEEDREHIRSFSAYRDTPIRIQHSEVTRTPWVDVEDEEAQQ